jgi:hypothetical protein
VASYTNIPQKIRAYHGDLVHNLHHRYRSWEHCYSFFRRIGPTGIVTNRDEAAVQLGFYLASWGMYRGSGFLLQHAYTVHLKAVDSLTSPTFAPLWDSEFGSKPEHSKLVPTVFAAIEALNAAYEHVGKPTDTLVTKVMLGTFGCLPACDRYFIDGFKSKGLRYSYLNPKFIERVLDFCGDNRLALRSEQRRIKAISGLRYPIMKLVDMYFWQIGYERGLSQ